MEGYYVEFNGDEWQSIFPSVESNKSQLHRNIVDAVRYMNEECDIPISKINLVAPAKDIIYFLTCFNEMSDKLNQDDYVAVSVYEKIRIEYLEGK